MLSLQMIKNLFVIVNFNPDFCFSLPRHCSRFMKVCHFVFVSCLAEVLPTLLFSGIESLFPKRFHIYALSIYTRLLFLLLVEAILSYCKIFPTIAFIFVLGSWTENSTVFVLVVTYLPLFLSN